MEAQELECTNCGFKIYPLGLQNLFKLADKNCPNCGIGKRFIKMVGKTAVYQGVYKYLKFIWRKK